MHLKSILPDHLILWLEPGDRTMLPTSIVSQLKTGLLAGPGAQKYWRSLQLQYPSIHWQLLSGESLEQQMISCNTDRLWWYRPHAVTYHWDPYIFYQLTAGLDAILTLAIEEASNDSPGIALNPFNRLGTRTSPFNVWRPLGLGLISKEWIRKITVDQISQDFSATFPAEWDVAGIPQRSLNPIPGKRALFLDRDGVLNKRLPADYVKHPGEFEWLPNTWKAVRRLSTRFDYVFIVTNQQGIGKGLMSSDDLDVIHMQMLDALRNSKARVDGIYHCAGLSFENPPCRKPNTGMAWEAKTAFPDFSWSRSWMAGDAISDLIFGLRLGMQTAAIMEHANQKVAMLSDRISPDLYAFARSFKDLI
ncbi:MAG TPA: HAD-IIIA family hydrolase [Saprospiraceae bacterium]|nr:HAD-IIIA family hydrolase [Saprospiraceae bacterium]HPG08322.1 HAD-IIIA family hydrolase [Saprospiraceae bacterium]HQU55374.1 HAD-IIIA family hydrolase [Saprospiraceae bacterium]HRV85577.1 HAD-IIIA family hydrolase [Saprospiraceae bacterium]